MKTQKQIKIVFDLFGLALFKKPIGGDYDIDIWKI